MASNGEVSEISSQTAIDLYRSECLLKDIQTEQLVFRQPNKAQQEAWAKTLIMYFETVAFLIKMRHDAGKTFGWSWKTLEEEVKKFELEVESGARDMRRTARERRVREDDRSRRARREFEEWFQWRLTEAKVKVKA
ncbi:hypothetical protein EG329_014381 [Mollisiaceae sp. DMI_Dod_QoI]|nr:hypothetical protein EG329_014381 [Helotiales sp. DMI_Dod_QoI]